MNKLALPLVALMALSSAAHAAPITGITLSDLGAGVTPNAINNNGYVVGQDASGQACVYYNGTTTPIGTLGGTQSEARDINDNGTVVGWSYLSNGNKHAFKWTSGTGIVDMNPGSAYTFSAEAVNGGDEAVGWVDTGTRIRSTYWMNNGITSYLFGAINSKAFGINDNGEVVGVGLNSSGDPDIGYYWSGLGGSSGWTTGYYGYYPFAGISNNSVSAGQDGLIAAYLPVPDPGPLDIGKLSLADLAASCSAISDNGCLTGGYSGTTALLYDIANSHLYNMNDLLPSSSTFTELNRLSDINNQGQFVGVGLVGGVEHGFAGQIVVPEPSTLVLLAFGALAAASAAALRCFRRRRAISA